MLTEVLIDQARGLSQADNRAYVQNKVKNNSEEYSLDQLMLQSPIKKGDRYIRENRKINYDDPTPYWPRPPHDAPYNNIIEKRQGTNYYLGGEFYEQQLKAYCGSSKRNGLGATANSKYDVSHMFPNMRKGGEPFVNDDVDSDELRNSSDEDENQKDKKSIQKKPKYNFSKVESLLFTQKPEVFVTFDELVRFMGRELQAGDTIEAIREIVYPGEGVIIPSGRTGTVRKTKLDHREDFAAVSWEYCKGNQLYAIDTRTIGIQFMKKPIEVMIGLSDAPYTIQWPAADSIEQPGQDVKTTWQPFKDKTLQHPLGKPMKLRQGYNDKSFALESVDIPKMMLTVVKSAPVGVGGVQDQRRLQLVDYSESKSQHGIDKMCCFKPKKISGEGGQMRFEFCGDPNVFVMVRLSADPRIAPPFIHLNAFGAGEAFKRLTVWGIIKIKRTLEPFIKNQYDMIIPNNAVQMREAQKAKNQKVTHVEAHTVGINSLGVKWIPFVGKVRVWLQFKAEKLDNFISEWIVSEITGGGGGRPNVSIVPTNWCNGFEEMGFDLVRACVAPLSLQHRFNDIQANRFFTCGAHTSDWVDLPPSENWTKPKATKKKKKIGSLEDDDDDDESNNGSIKDTGEQLDMPLEIQSGTVEKVRPLGPTGTDAEGAPIDLEGMSFRTRPTAFEGNGLGLVAQPSRLTMKPMAVSSNEEEN